MGKAGSNIGGADIDTWIFQEFLKKHNLQKEEIQRHYSRLMRKIEQLKIELSQKQEAYFSITDQTSDYDLKFSMSRNELNDILKQNYFAATIQETIDNAVGLAFANGVQKKDIKKVFVVGGSSQLPYFQEIILNNFGKRVEISAEPFSAVIKGACNFISGIVVEDFLHHNYSLQHFNKDRGIYEYEVIVPEKTKFPLKNVKQIVIATPHTGQEEVELKFFEVMTNTYQQEKIEDITFKT